MVRIVFVMIVMMTSLMVSMVMIVLRSLGLKRVRVVLVNYDDDSDKDVNGDDCDGSSPDEVRGVRVQRATERSCVPPEKKMINNEKNTNKTK